MARDRTAPSRRPVFARSKFHAPAVVDTLVPRGHLVARLQGADALPLSIVVGAPGSGKTSLLAEWYHAADDGTIAWMSADAGDADPTRFWRAFIRALQQVETAFGTEADDLISLDGGVTADTLESLLDDDQRLRGRVRLVLDDFHMVSLDAARQLQHLLHRGLRGVRLVIGSRSDPAIGLHRLRLDGSVCEIRDADLRFDLSETGALIHTMGVDATSLDVGALHRRTEGWAAGVQMVALSLVGADDPSARAAQLVGNNQTVAGYLTGEVLASQTPRIRRFLENTCVADELDSDLVHALMADEPAGVEPVTLEEIESLHLLLTRVDASGTVFRYHRLFLELLRSSVAARDPERLRRQHALAAAYFESSGRVLDAIHHHWHADHRGVAARLVSRNTVAVVLHHGTPPPIDTHREVTDGEMLDAPEEVIGYALSFVKHGRADLARSLLGRADRLFDGRTMPISDRTGLHCVRVGVELQFGDLAAAIPHVEAVLRLIGSEGAPIDGRVAAAAPFCLRVCAWQEQFELAEQVRRVVGDSIDPALAGVEMAGALATLDLERGAVAAAAATAERARDMAVATGASGGPADLAARAVLAAALLDQCHFAAASGELAAVREVSSAERLPAYVMASIAMARSLRSDGHFDEARAVLRQARARCEHPSDQRTLVGRIDLADIDLLLAVGDLRTAGEMLAAVDAGWRSEVAAARIDLALGRPAAAAARLDAVDIRIPRQAVTVASLRLAVALSGAGAGSTARGTDHGAGRLADAVIDLAEPHHLLLPIAEAGSDVLQAVAAAARRRNRSPFVDRLLNTQPLPLPTSMATPRVKADELSSRELVVLRYMATSMSNQEIADELYVSVNTVKTHIKHVLRKLGASSRTEAVQRARAVHYL